MKQKIGFMLLPTLAVALSATPVQAAVTYNITDLGGVTPTGINAGGQITGYYVGANSIVHSFLYSNGSMTDLGSLSGNKGSTFANAINDKGEITGESDATNNQRHAFLYSNGQMTDIGALFGANSYTSGVGINNNGQIIGHNFLYDNGQISGAAVPGIYQPYLTGINDSGQMTGRGASLSYPFGADGFLLSNGQTLILDTQPSDNQLWQSATPFALNANGDVTGSACIRGSNLCHAFLYSNGKLNDIDGGDFGNSTGVAINANGDVVGDAPNAMIGTSYAFVYHKGSAVQTNLNTLIASNSGWYLTKAVDINDSGQIIGYGLNSQHTLAGFLLTPVAVPLPGALQLFISAGMGLLLLGKGRNRLYK